MEKKRNELIAKLENLGPLHFFFTLSCADMRYEENFTSLLQEFEIIYNVEKGRERAYIVLNDQEISLDEFRRQNESKQ